MSAWVIFRSVQLHHMTAPTHRVFRLSPTSSNSEVSPIPSMALLRFHRQCATVAFVLITLLAERLSSTQILEACQECQIPWLLHPQRVTLGLFLRNSNRTTGGNRAVVSLVQGTPTSHRARTALPHPSTAASTPQIHNFPLVRSVWTMACPP